MSKTTRHKKNRFEDSDDSASNFVSGSVDAEAGQITTCGDMAGRDSTKAMTLNFSNNVTFNVSGPIPTEAWNELLSMKASIPEWTWDGLRVFAPTPNIPIRSGRGDKTSYAELIDALKAEHFADRVLYGGVVPAGEAKTYDLPEDSLLKSDGLFAVTITGISMIGAKIFPGSTWLVDTKSTPRVGDIVVAYLKESHGRTIKRLLRDNVDPAYIVLHAENPEYADMRVHINDVEIHGVIVRKVESVRDGFDLDD